MAVEWTTALALFRGVQDGLKTVIPLLQDAKSKAAVKDVEDRLGKARDSLVELQEKAFQQNEQLRQLQLVNDELRKKQDDDEEWKQKLALYPLKPFFPNGAVVRMYDQQVARNLMRRVESPHSLCPNCFGQRNEQVLYPKVDGNPVLICGECDFRAFTHHVSQPHRGQHPDRPDYLDFDSRPRGPS